MNDTQAQARPKRPALEEVEAYVRGKGYDDRGSANAFYGNFFYAYHDARAAARGRHAGARLEGGGGRVARDGAALPRAGAPGPRRGARSDSRCQRRRAEAPAATAAPLPSAAPCLRSRSRT